jgi:DNA repair protein RadD
MALKDAHVMRPDTMLFDISADRKKAERLSVSYYDLDGQALKEHFYLSNPSGQAAFYYKFSRMHLKVPESNIRIKSAKDAVEKQYLFRMPRFVIARKKKHHWSITEKIF